MQKMIKAVILVSALFFIGRLWAENWNLELIREVEYSEDNCLESVNFSSLSQLNDSLLTFHSNSQHYIFNLNSYETISFGAKGSGPGEFVDSSPLLEIGEKRFCIDAKKSSIMIFDCDNKLIVEKKTEINDKWLVYADGFLVAKNIPFAPDDKLLKFYDLEGEFRKAEWRLKWKYWSMTLFLTSHIITRPVNFYIMKMRSTFSSGGCPVI